MIFETRIVIQGVINKHFSFEQSIHTLFVSSPLIDVWSVGILPLTVRWLRIYETVSYIRTHASKQALQ